MGIGAGTGKTISSSWLAKIKLREFLSKLDIKSADKKSPLIFNGSFTTIRIIPPRETK